MTDYAVVLLVEQELSTLDAHQVRGLHEDIDEPVRYHVLLPVEDAAYRVESAMGSLGSAEMANPGLLVDEAEIAEMQSEILTSARTALKNTVAALEAAGGTAVGDLLTADPIDGLIAKVAETDAAEAIILTRPHVVSEFFHLDWTSRARRKLGVPVRTPGKEFDVKRLWLTPMDFRRDMRLRDAAEKLQTLFPLKGGKKPGANR